MAFPSSGSFDYLRGGRALVTLDVRTGGFDYWHGGRALAVAADGLAITGTATAGQGSQTADAVALMQSIAAATSGQGSQSVDAVAATGTGGDGSSGQGSQTVDASGSTDVAFSGTAESGQGGQTIDASALLQFSDVGVTNITGAAQSGQGQTSDAVGAVPAVAQQFSGGRWVPQPRRVLAIHGTATSGQGGQTVDAVGNVISIRTLKQKQNNRRAVLAAALLFDDDLAA